MLEYNMKQQAFIEQIIIPAEIGSMNKEIYSLIYDLSGKVIFVTKLLNEIINYHSPKPLLGRTVSELKIYKEAGISKQLEQIRKQVITNQRTVYYIIFAQFSYGFDAHAIYQFPLFMPDGSVIASKVIGKQFSLYSSVLCFNKFLKTPQPEDPALPSEVEQFTQLETEILFLLFIGLTQEEAAGFLGISRGYLAKTLVKSIYVKLGISNKDDLIPLLTKYNLIKKIPERFMQPKVILLEGVNNER